MANLNIGVFDANQHEPSVPFEPLPAAKYLAVITKSEMKVAKSGNGSFLELELTIVAGPQRNKKAWDRLCINHTKDITQKIARGKLSSICRAVNVMQLHDSVELHNKVMLVSIGCKKREDNGEMGNIVRGYEPRPTAKTATPIGQQAPLQTAPPEVSPIGEVEDTAPWQQ